MSYKHDRKAFIKSQESTLHAHMRAKPSARTHTHTHKIQVAESNQAATNLSARHLARHPDSARACLLALAARLIEGGSEDGEEREA